MTSVCRWCGTVPAVADRYCSACGRLLDHAVPPGSNSPAGSPPVPASLQPSSPRGRRAVTALIAIALVSCATGVYVGLLGHRPASAGTGSAPGQSATPRPGTAELHELQHITLALQKSVQARSAIDQAVLRVGGCRMKPAQGISILRSAITARQEAAAEVEKQSGHVIPDGKSLLSDLLQALRQSSTADNGFIGWMHDIAGSGTCPINTATDSSYQAGYQASKRALAAKRQFVQLWNPLAQEFGQPRFRANSI